MIKQFGAVPEPVEATWHNPRVAEASLELGGKVREWDAADESLKSFAHMAVSVQVGFSFCLDVGYFQAQNQTLDMAKPSQVPRSRESKVFTLLRMARMCRTNVKLLLGGRLSPRVSSRSRAIRGRSWRRPRVRGRCTVRR